MPSIAFTSRRSAPAPTLAGTIALAGLWLALYRPVLAYLTIIYGREDFRTNQIALVGVAALIAARAGRPALRAALAAGPRPHRPALALAVGASLAYLACERYLAINTVSATLFGLATFGLAGLWLEPAAWRRGFPAAVLLVGTLPFGEHLQTFVGYPLRVATAAAVGDGLAAFGARSVGADTILVFENGVSHVDLPCSGIKSLWTGLLFLVAATWVERRRLSWSWLAVAGVVAGLLVAANAARVAALVAVGVVAGWPRLAEMLHVPLGVLGFAAACAAGVALVRRAVPPLDPLPAADPAPPLDPRPVAATPTPPLDSLPVAPPAPSAPEAPSRHPRPAPWLLPALVATVAVLVAAYQPRAITAAAAPTPSAAEWSLPPRSRRPPSRCGLPRRPTSPATGPSPSHATGSSGAAPPGR